MDLRERRAILKTSTNPDTKLDYLVTLKGHLSTDSEGTKTRVYIRYVPDRLIVDSSSFGKYLEALGTVPWDSPEDLAVTILNDLINESVARWLQVVLSKPDVDHDAIENHGVILEERQPRWDNPALLSRLKPI